LNECNAGASRIQQKLNKKRLLVAVATDEGEGKEEFLIGRRGDRRELKSRVEVINYFAWSPWRPMRARLMRDVHAVATATVRKLNQELAL
jgi:hypothetical protein